MNNMLCRGYDASIIMGILIHIKVQAQVNSMLCRGYDASIMMGILPVATFCSGQTLFVQQMQHILARDVCTLHFGFR